MEKQKLSAIMFTDMVGFSKKMSQNEKEALLLLEIHNNIILNQIGIFKGNVIKTIGDAFLSNFESVENAVLCAIAIQQDFYNHNKVKKDKKIEVRIGIHIGDIIFTKDDVFGNGVNIASRIESLAEANEILLSGQVYSMIKDKLDLEYHFMGTPSLKNINEPIKIFSIIWNRELKEKYSSQKKHRTFKIFFAWMGIAAVIVILFNVYVWFTFHQNPVKSNLYPPLTTGNSMSWDFESSNVGNAPVDFKVLGDENAYAEVVDENAIKPFSGAQFLQLVDDSSDLSLNIDQTLDKIESGVVSCAFHISSASPGDLYFRLRSNGEFVLDIRITNLDLVKIRDLDGKLQDYGSYGLDQWHILKIDWDTELGIYTVLVDDANIGKFPFD